MSNSAFSSALPGLQLAWDSTTLGQLKTCPRLYWYSNIAGSSPDLGASGYAPRLESVHLTFGLVMHGARERYDHARAQGEGHESALRIALRYALEATWNRELGRPWLSDDKNKNRLTLIRTIVWYLDDFAEDSLRTVILASGKPAVEVSFRMELGAVAPTGEPYLLCGHFDRVATLNDTTYISDIKTTKSTVSPDFFEKFSPGNQFSLYCLAAKVVYALPVRGLIVDAAQVAVTFSRFQRGIVQRTEAQLEEWLSDALWWIAQAARFAAEGYWPMNDTSCDRFGGCPFRSVCSASPSVRAEWLRRDFVRRTWNPLATRGDI